MAKGRKLSYDRVLEIKKLRGENLSIRQIAEAIGSSSVTVLKYLASNELETGTPERVVVEKIQRQLDHMQQQILFLTEQIESVKAKGLLPVKKQSNPSPIQKDTISNDINPDDGEWISLEEAMKLVDRSRPYLSKLCNEKRIQSIKKSKGGQGKGNNVKCWIINKKSLLKYKNE